MRDAAETSLDVTQELERVLQHWIGSLPPGAAVMQRRRTPGAYDQFEIIPSDPGASRILIHEDDEPARFKVYLGRGTWWDRIPLEGSIVERICHAVARGHFTEFGRVWGRRVLATNGELKLDGGEVWRDRGSSSLLALLPIGTVTRLGYAPYSSSGSAA